VVFTADIRLKIAAVAATAAGDGQGCRAASEDRLKIAAVAATAAGVNAGNGIAGFAASRLPQSRRLRPEPSCAPWFCAPASRLPQSRRLRLIIVNSSGFTRIRLKIAAVAATAAILGLTDSVKPDVRLKIAAVAATAACYMVYNELHPEPPQDCRSRGDCGTMQ